VKPIQASFRAAGRLVNEWRDTLFYSYFVLNAVTGFVQGEKNAIGDLLHVSSSRELLRFVSWAMHQDAQRVGTTFPAVKKYQNATAAAITTGLLWLSENFPPSVPQPHFLTAIIDCLYLALVSYSFLGLGGRFENLPKLYFDEKTGMWDWRRKRGDGGTTQIQKIIDGLKKIGQKLGGLLPAPLPVPGHARIAKPHMHAPR